MIENRLDTFARPVEPIDLSPQRPLACFGAPIGDAITAARSQRLRQSGEPLCRFYRAAGSGSVLLIL